MVYSGLDIVKAKMSANGRRSGKTSIDVETNWDTMVHPHLDITRAHWTQSFYNSDRFFPNVRKVTGYSTTGRAFDQVPPQHDCSSDCPIAIAETTGRIFLAGVPQVLLDNKSLSSAYRLKFFFASHLEDAASTFA
jgi:hypothetical protein